MLTSRTSDAFIALLKTQVGYHEGHDRSGWNNHEKYADAFPDLEMWQDQAWCQTFECWGLETLNALAPFKATGSVSNFYDQGIRLGRNTQYPCKGAIANLRNGQHTFAVASYDDNNVYTVEGNTNDNGSAEGDGVYAKTRPRHSANITGYTIPFFDEYYSGPDPAWRGKWLGRGPAPDPHNAIPLNFLLTCMRAHRTNPVIANVQKLLGVTADGAWGPNTQAAYDAFRHAHAAQMGWTAADCTGEPGAESLNLLCSLHGWRQV